ncbi:MAG TPA: aldo/keto reductase, partial [Burkholderiales bacterium]|nr:aldo/keto reductase [Burkholderiales bacterium]
MKYRLLGRTGVRVSQLCLGTMSFGGDADERASAAMYRTCRDTGVNFFDTADQYNKGRSEEILGKLMRGERENLVIATKCFNPTGTDINARGSARRHVSRALEASLKRLGTDRIEILYLHHYDALTPLEEQMRALEDLVRAGKVLYPAVSNFAAWQTQAALGVQERGGWARVQAIQPMYSLVKRQAEVELLPMAAANGLSVFPYSPGAGGLLSGKYSENQNGRLTTNKMYQARYGEGWVHETAARFAGFCRERNLHPMSAAVAWVGSHP